MINIQGILTCLGGSLGVVPPEELEVQACAACCGGGGGVEAGRGLALLGRRGGPVWEDGGR